MFCCLRTYKFVICKYLKRSYEILSTLAVNGGHRVYFRKIFLRIHHISIPKSETEKGLKNNSSCNTKKSDIVISVL
jgi:hypothetical protein